MRTRLRTPRLEPADLPARAADVGVRYWVGNCQSQQNYTKTCLPSTNSLKHFPTSCSEDIQLRGRRHENNPARQLVKRRRPTLCSQILFENCSWCGVDSQVLRVFPECHVTVMSACEGGSSVCTESVHCTVCHCARVALATTIGSDARVQAVKQWNEHHVIHAGGNNTGLILCSAHLMRKLQVLSRMFFKPLSKPRFSCLDAHPSIHVCCQDHGCVLFDTPTTVSNNKSLLGA